MSALTPRHPDFGKPPQGSVPSCIPICTHDGHFVGDVRVVPGVPIAPFSAHVNAEADASRIPMGEASAYGASQDSAYLARAAQVRAEADAAFKGGPQDNVRIESRGIPWGNRAPGPIHRSVPLPLEPPTLAVAASAVLVDLQGCHALLDMLTAADSAPVPPSTLVDGFHPLTFTLLEVATGAAHLRTRLSEVLARVGVL